MEEQQYEFILDRENPDKPNIMIEADDGIVRIIVNGYKLFNTLANIGTILVGLNDKTKELIQKHLVSKAMEVATVIIPESVVPVPGPEIAWNS